MYINQGNKSFMILDISPQELSNIFDAFQICRSQYIELLKLDDNELKNVTKGQKEKIPELKKILQQKIDFFEKHQKKIMSYAK